MSTKPRSVFPEGTSPVRTDKDLFLLHCRYSKRHDMLRILYKNVKTNEKILDEIPNPQVPVFMMKNTPKFFKDFVPYDMCYPIMVSYKNKSEDIQRNLFPIRTWKYFDRVLGIEKTQIGFENLKPDTMRKGPEFLHPQLLFADVTIEHLVNMEYCIHRYEDLGDNVRMENIPRPSIDLAAFDIETSMDENGNPYINTNTFVDRKSMTAYGYFLKKDEYKYQEQILNDPEWFKEFFREKFKWAIDNMKLDAKPDKIEFVKNLGLKYLDELKIVVKGFDTEQKLIFNSCKLMFTEHDPDLLMAFNTAYDSSIFQRRITELNMPVGTFNSHRNPAWLETSPPIAEDLNEFWELRGDTIDPKKRATRFDNISTTQIVDYANAYYSNRKGGTFSSMSLDATSSRELGFGKLDYSHICNHILKLPFEDFRIHLAYALVDSILLLILEEVTKDFDSKITYVARTKSDMASTAYNNQAISRCIHSEAFYDGNIPGNNYKKYIGKFTNEELRKIQDITKIDYVKLNKLYDELPGKNKGDIRGGIN
ncbi:MAG: hypothetical protein ACRCX2_20840 [Paraclostridium sp.]